MPPSVSPSERREIQRRSEGGEGDESDSIRSNSPEEEKEGPEELSSSRDRE